jgi:hypothetical protein
LERCYTPKVKDDRMSRFRLNDLDEIILKVRDRISQQYIAEAVDAYRGGAYRASTISTWIAVTSDIISKIRELASQGDGNAKSIIELLDKAITTNNVPQLQKLENELLQKAHHEFEFLSISEHEDLSRLRHDRNLCAHPAFVEEGVLFQPTPELVRTHIVHAVQHLLQHQPIQGKSALNKVLQDLARSSFPTNLDDVTEYLTKKYFNRAKDVLIRNLTTLLLKESLKGENPDLIGREQAILNTLLVISNKFPILYEEIFKNKLSSILDTVDDTQLKRVFALLEADQRCWDWLDEPSQIRINNIIDNLDFDEMVGYEVFKLISLTDFRQTLLDKFMNFDVEDKVKAISVHPCVEFKSEAIELYGRARSYREAESYGENILLPIATLLTPKEVEEVLLNTQENSQIHDASGTPAIMVRFFEKTKHLYSNTKDAWEKFLAAMPIEPDSRYSYHKLQKRLKSFELT